MKLEFTEDEGSSQPVVSNGYITYPRGFAAPGSSAWKRIVGQWAKCDWLEEFFVDEREFVRFIRQVSFLMSLVYVAKGYPRANGVHVVPFPFFRLESVADGLGLLGAFLRPDSFTAELARQVFAEGVEDFVKGWPDRCGTLSDYPQGTYWLEDLPCDVFSNR